MIKQAIKRRHPGFTSVLRFSVLNDLLADAQKRGP